MDKRKRESEDGSTGRKSFSIFGRILERTKKSEAGDTLTGFDYKSMPQEKSPILGASATQMTFETPTWRPKSMSADQPQQAPSHNGSSQMLPATPENRLRLDLSSPLPPPSKPQPWDKRSSFVQPLKRLRKMTGAHLLSKHERHIGGVSDDGDEDQSNRPSSGQASELLRNVQPVPQPPVMHERSNTTAYDSLSRLVQSQQSEFSRRMLPGSARYIPGSSVQQRHGNVFQDDRNDVRFAPPSTQSFSPRLSLNSQPPYLQWTVADSIDGRLTEASTLPPGYGSCATSHRGPEGQAGFSVYRSAEPPTSAQQQGAYFHSINFDHQPVRCGLPGQREQHLIDFARNADVSASQHVPARLQPIGYPPLWAAEESRHQQQPPEAEWRRGQLQHEVKPVQTSWTENGESMGSATAVYGAPPANLDTQHPAFSTPTEPAQAGLAMFQLPALDFREGHPGQHGLDVRMLDTTIDYDRTVVPRPRRATRSCAGSRVYRDARLPAIEEEGQAPIQAVGGGSAVDGLMGWSSNVENDNAAYTRHAGPNGLPRGDELMPRSFAGSAVDATDPSLFFTNRSVTLQPDTQPGTGRHLPHFEVAETRPMNLLREPVDIDWASVGIAQYQLSGEVDAGEEHRSGVGYSGTPRVFRS